MPQPRFSVAYQLSKHLFPILDCVHTFYLANTLQSHQAGLSAGVLSTNKSMEQHTVYGKETSNKYWESVSYTILIDFSSGCVMNEILWTSQRISINKKIKIWI